MPFAEPLTRFFARFGNEYGIRLFSYNNKHFSARRNFEKWNRFRKYFRKNESIKTILVFHNHNTFFLNLAIGLGGKNKHFCVFLSSNRYVFFGTV